jgi:hypothetical protein
VGADLVMDLSAGVLLTNAIREHMHAKYGDPPKGPYTQNDLNLYKLAGVMPMAKKKDEGD